MWWICALVLSKGGYEASIAACEKGLTDPVFSYAGRWSEPPQYRLEEVDDRLQAILAKHGPRSETYRALGICSIHMGAYDDALGFLRRAQEANPGDKGTREARDEAAAKSQVAKAVMKEQPSLPGVIMVEPIGGDVWAVLTGTDHTEYQEDLLGLIHATKTWRRGKVALRIVSYMAGTIHVRWVSKPLRYDDADEFTEATLFVRDLDRDGSLEFGVWAAIEGADHWPNVFEAYRLRPAVKRIAHIQGNESFRVKDLDADGKIEVERAYCIGTDAGHAQAPRWFDTYEPAKDGYRLANGRFKKRYVEIKAEIEATLKKIGPDSELEIHLARIEGIFGRWASARRHIEAAARLSWLEYRDRREGWERAGDVYRERKAQIAEARRGLASRQMQ
jgi:tetratricopeptide (TPR) repeat protein